MRRTGAGFSFMEVLVSLVMITAVATGGVTAFLHVRRAAALTQQRITAVQLAEKKIVELKRVGSGVTPASSGPLDTGELHHGTLQVIVSDMPVFPGASDTDIDFKKVQVIVRWDNPWNAAAPANPAQSREHSQVLTTVFFVPAIA